jgi:diaminopimelate epimerase
MRIPFVKAHGAGNDFLLTWKRDAPAVDPAGVARSICSRHTGVGADGWYLVDPGAPAADASLRLFNSDGSPAELSGNGTRCAAAMLVDEGLAGAELRILTGAGEKRLRLIERQGRRFRFEMEIGRPSYHPEEICTHLALAQGPIEVSILDVGNPQCAVFVEEFPPDWKSLAAEIEGHARFPNRTNVSFVRRLDAHTLEARFYERGAGETLSSGTGSAGAAVAAMLRGLVASPVSVLTAAGALEVCWEPGGPILQTGPAEIVARGEYYF